MNCRPIMMFLIAALMLLGVGASALAAENVRTQARVAEVSHASCRMNGRMVFKYGSTGWLENYPKLFAFAGAQYAAPGLLFSLSTKPEQCPAVYGVKYSAAAYRAPSWVESC